METVMLWAMRLMDAGPEFYVLLTAFVAYVYLSQHQHKAHKDALAAQLAHEKAENGKLWQECRTLSHRLEADNRHVMNKLTGGKAEVIKELRDSSASLWKKYNQVDKLGFGMALAIQTMGGPKLIKQSADGSGDYALNHDIKPEAK